VSIGGQRIRTIDIHCHCVVTEVIDLVKGTSLEQRIADSLDLQRVPVGPERLRLMDPQGIDLQVLSVNPFWHGADRDLAQRIVDLQNAQLSALSARYPDRFAAFATVALQFPELAAEQLERAVKQQGLRGAGIAANVEGE